MTKAQIIDPKTGVATTPKQVLVEDSITHQSGDGVTTGMAAAVETPDTLTTHPKRRSKPKPPPTKQQTIKTPLLALLMKTANNANSKPRRP